MSKLSIARSRRPAPILVCKKCLKRCSNGSRIKRALKAELKHERSDGSKQPRVVATGCLGICPKSAVVLTNGHRLRNGEFVLVSDRRDIREALGHLRAQ
jgi:hypothetical protein